MVAVCEWSLGQYDRTCWVRELLVLLPTLMNKLHAQWQGSYLIVSKTGEANYVVDIKDKNKQLRTFHGLKINPWR